MRLIHTADWHLGHTLGGFSREAEHRRFLDWLLDRIEEERADAVVVAGDVFETGNAPAPAQALYYGWLAEARRRFPDLGLVVVGGNHDAAPRLDAPGPILRSMRVHVVGAMPRTVDGVIDHALCVVPLVGRSGDVEAWCAAVPFLRMTDLGGGADVVDAVAQTYARVLDVVRAKRRDGQAIVAIGHCHMHGGKLSDESERPVFGNAFALPVDIFPDDVTYAALGHLHFAQCVGGRENVRYSGSPTPLSMTERDYKHQVVVVDLAADAAGNATCTTRPLLVPRTAGMIRVPESPCGVDELLDRLRFLELPHGDFATEAPFLEVRARLDAPCPDLRARVESALDGKHVRLVGVKRELAGEGAPLANTTTAASLHEIDPVHVLTRLYQRTYGGAVPDDILDAFRELVDAARDPATALAASTTPRML